MRPMLAIDTSSDETSLAVIAAGREIERVSVKSAHNEDLAVLAASALCEAGIEAGDVACFAAGAGPGSFTGLRIGFSFIKGMALFAARPLRTVSSLAACAAEFRGEGRLLCALGDARRSECFAAVYAPAAGGALNELRAPCIVADADLGAWLNAAQEESGAADSDVVVASVHARPISAGTYRTFRPRHTARSVAELAALCGDYELSFGVDGLAEQEPCYLRAVAAKTIAEREAEKRRM